MLHIYIETTLVGAIFDASRREDKKRAVQLLLAIKNQDTHHGGKGGECSVYMSTLDLRYDYVGGRGQRQVRENMIKWYNPPRNIGLWLGFKVVASSNFGKPRPRSI